MLLKYWYMFFLIKSWVHQGIYRNGTQYRMPSRKKLIRKQTLIAKCSNLYGDIFIGTRLYFVLIQSLGNGGIYINAI